MNIFAFKKVHASQESIIGKASKFWAVHWKGHMRHTSSKHGVDKSIIALSFLFFGLLGL
jgi:hypothetical protein